MIYYELLNTVYVKNDISSRFIPEKLSRIINFSMEKRKYLKDLHEEKKMKFYCFDYLYPIEKDGEYKAKKIYVFKLKTPIKEIAEEFAKALSITENDDLKILGSSLKIKKFNFKEEVYTVTPAICTLGNKYWTKEDGIERIEEQIEKNLVKKYIQIFNQNPKKESDFINFIEQKNKKNIVINFKKGKLLGHKFSIRFNQDEISQKMAYIALSTGILEKGSLGCGFCI